MDFHIVKMHKDKVVNKNVKHILFINVWRKCVFDIYFTELGAVLTTVLPVHCSNILFIKVPEHYK
jgi:hypothetical protein